MSTFPLPEDPSFESLRKRAKDLLRAVRAGEAEARARFGELHPRGTAALEHPTLADAQLVLARAFGFASWPRLKHHLEAVERFGWHPRSPGEERSPEEELVRAGCLTYDEDPLDLARAERVLAEHPELTRESVWAAAAAGEAEAVRAALEHDPGLVAAKGGPLAWEPLLYACYSRIEGPGRSTLEVARLLLARGADPNAGFLWHGNVPPFTALTGAFGEGEDGANQPPHPARDELARLLLEAGADPNDGQTLYDRHFRADDGHLRLFFEFGLGKGGDGPWFARLGERLQSPRQMLVEELWAAAKKGFAERVELLLAHGADPNGRGARDGRTPYEVALGAGQRAIAESLARHGARRTELPIEGRFAGACVAGDGAEARALLAQDPGLSERLGASGRAELVARAVEARSHAGLRLMAELGFELSFLGRNTPLHEAAWAGDVALVELLLSLGADPLVREPTYGATPLGWAAHNRQRAVVELLLPRADLFDALAQGAVERAAELLREDPARARASGPGGEPPVFSVPFDSPRAPEVIELLAAHGADLAARDAEGRTALERAEAAQRPELVDLLRRLGGAG